MSAPKTVLMVSNHGSIVGGGEISMLSLLQGLDRTQWRPVVVVPEDGEVAKRCQAVGLPTHVIPLPGLRCPGPALIASLRDLKALISATGARLVHANGSRAMAYAGVAGRLAGRSVLWHVRVADREAVLDRVLSRLARLIIVNSHAVGRRFSGQAASRVRCIYNGIDVTQVSPRTPPPHLRRSLGLPETASVIVSVGRFVRYKGYDYLLDAARIVASERPDTHWVLIGDGELRESLEERVRQTGLDKQIHFTGWREDVADLIALGDFFITPAIGEHFGRVVIEAMAIGKAVIATASGGTPEIVLHGETGLLVPPADPDALARAMLTLLTDRRQTEQLGRAGRTRAIAEFDLARHVQAVQRLYEECAGDGHGTL
jgi:glycosyltransferase involved in cell wall biosynthesis